MEAFITVILFQWCIFCAEGSHVTVDCYPCVCDTPLKRADCSYRKLSDIPKNLPLDIQYLNLTGNRLTKVRGKSFQNYYNLIHLSLEANKLGLLEGVYDSDAFDGLRNLQVLRISLNCNYMLNRSQPYSYPAKSLSKLKTLRELFIDGVPNDVFGNRFRDLQELQNITFEGFCYLDYIKQDMFVNTPHLRFLNISNCYIYDIDNEAFSPLSSIDILDISGNTELGLINASSSTYGLQNSSIRVLYLNHVVPPFSVGIVLQRNFYVYLQNTSITELHIDHNWIEVLEPGTMYHYPQSLKTLSVKDNRFIAGPYILESRKMKGLTNIDISDIGIAHPFFSANPSNFDNQVIWGPPDFEVVTARNMLLVGYIPQFYINVSRIMSIDMSNNILTDWIGPVKYFQSLRYVDLSKCFCSNIAPTFFPSFPNLVFLNISYNLIGDALKRDLNGTLFQSLTLLENLDLSANRIRYIKHNVFESNIYLKYLNLSNNDLSYWSFKIQLLKSLIEFDVRQNQIRSLYDNRRVTLDEIPQNLSIDLSGNPLQCTCENINFLIWMSIIRHHLKNFESYTCVDALNNDIKLNLTLVTTLTSKCKSFFGYIAGSLFGIVLFFTVSIMGLVYRFRWRIKYLYYVARDRHRHLRENVGEARHYDFDAFVSYSDENMHFVENLLNNLEGQGKRLCVHHRDFKLGEPISANIVKAVQRSRRTIIILSHQFLSGTWCRYEFEMAKMEAVHEGRDVILVVKIEDIDSADIPREMMYMMKTDSYAKFPEKTEDQPAFWLNLNSAI